MMTIEQYLEASRRHEIITPENAHELVCSPELWNSRTGDAAQHTARTESQIFGDIAHDYLLDNASFDAKYLVADGPVNPKTGAPYGVTTKAYADWLATIGRPVVSTGMLPVLKSMREKYEMTVPENHIDRVIALRGVELNDRVGILMGKRAKEPGPGVSICALVDCIELAGPVDQTDTAWRTAIDVRTTSCIENVLSGSMDELRIRLMVMELATDCAAVVRLVEKSNPSRTLDIGLSADSRESAYRLVSDAIGHLVDGRAGGAWRNRYLGTVRI